MQKIRKEWNEFSSCWETYYWDDVAEKMIIKNTYDVSGVLESNKKLKNSTIDKTFSKGIFHHMAEIPNVFIHKFLTEHNLDVFSKDPSEQLRLRRLLESSEYSFLKTHTKKLYRPVSKRKDNSSKETGGGQSVRSNP